MENKNSESPEVAQARNKSFLATPSFLKFFYKDEHRGGEKELKLTNISSFSHRLCILPPVTKYFKITGPKYVTRMGWIAAGLSISIKVSFVPNEMERPRHYKDYIRILCDTGKNEIRKDVILNTMALTDDSILQIPLLALPHNPHCNFPDEISFGRVQLGQSVQSNFTISPIPGQKVVFFIAVPQETADFSIYPLYGVLNENDPPAVINIKFTPSAYKTVQLPIKVCIPNSSMTPYIIKLTGICKPWKTSERKEYSMKSKYFQNFEGKSIILSPSSKMRRLKLINPEIPLNTIHGVAKFLSTKPTKEKDPYFDLIGPLGMYQEVEKAIVDEFERQFSVKVNKKKERLQHLFHRNEIAVGPSPNDPQIEKMAEIIVDRIIAKKNFEDLQLLEKPEKLFRRTNELQLRRRVVRDVEIIQPKFTQQPDNIWPLRYQILSHFVQSARKIIIHNRLLKMLKLLKEALPIGGDYVPNKVLTSEEPHTTASICEARV